MRRISFVLLLHICICVTLTSAKPGPQEPIVSLNSQSKFRRLAGYSSNFPPVSLKKEQDALIHPFQVDVPLKVPNTRPCTVNIVLHEFASSFGVPFVGKYTPPVGDKCAGRWNKVVLDLTGKSRGRQFDRLAGLFIGGVDIFRTSTPEPTISGIEWKVQKDVTSYSSLLHSPQTVVFDLPNIITDVYNGTYVISVNLLFYAAKDSAYTTAALDVADLIIPISASSNSSGWFSLQSFNDVAARNVTFPRNLKRVVVEVYANGQINDEFWYTNPPTDYLRKLNQTGPRNGAYREVLVYVDQLLAGATVTYPVIFSGGISPTFWRPVLDHTALNILSYYVDVTPFVGLLVDGKPHNISLRVVNANYFWLVDANLHLWIDRGTKQTVGALIKHDIEPNATIAVIERIAPNLDANFTTAAKRATTLVGWVKTSTHLIRTTVNHVILFNNDQEFTNRSNAESWSQNIIQVSTITTSTKALGRSLRQNALTIQTTNDNWPFSGFASTATTSDGGFIIHAHLDQGFSRKTLDKDGFVSKVQERQTGSGAFGRTGDGELIGGLPSTTLNTTLKYSDSTKRKYSREVDVKDAVILFDKESSSTATLRGWIEKVEKVEIAYKN